MLKSISVFLARLEIRFYFFDHFAALLHRQNERHASHPYPGFYNAKYLQSARQFIRVSIALLLLFGLQLSASAQCKTFLNADEANPMFSALPIGSNVVGFDFVDIDADGDQDMYVILTDGFPQLYLNIGSAHRPEFQKSRLSGFENVILPAGSPTIQFVDIDGDKDFDCFLSDVSHESRPVTGVKFYRNDGNLLRPHYIEDEANNPVNFARTSISYMMFMFADIDKDGDFDFYYTGMYNYTFNAYDQQTYLNTGSATAASYTLYQNEHNHDFKNQRTFYDWSLDGLTDYFRIDNYNNITEYWRNNGNVNMPSFSLDAANAPVFNNGLPARMADLNGDGAAEAFTDNGHYSTLAPLAVIEAKTVTVGGRIIKKLTSKYQSDNYNYSWEWNGKAIDGQIKPNLYAVQPGRYTLFVTDDCGTGVSLSYVVSSESSNDSKENRNIATPSQQAANIQAVIIRSYPNPFTSELLIQLPSTKGDSYTIKMTDLQGRVMLTQKTNSSNLRIGRNLPSGTYFLEVFQGSKNVYHTTVLKQ